jgi:hypothetical protein
MNAVLAITGLPGAGKTTLADALGVALNLPVMHTDDYKDQPWAEQAPLCTARLLEAYPFSCIVEGLTVARMFRYGFRPHAVIHILGGREPVSASLRSLVSNGMIAFNGRIVTLPKHPSVREALSALGKP